MKFRLKRTVQCARCPWKVSTDPYDIPNGYDVEKHKNLSCTISDGRFNLSQIKAMACHHSKEGNEEYCVGWLHNQLGVGNNIALRIKMMGCENAHNIKTKGKQHQRFEDTLPE